MAISPDNGADDLGLGRRVAEESVARLLKPDGSFNVQRHGRSFFQSLHLYHSLLTMSWPRFVGAVTVSYLAANLLFAAGYLLCGRKRWPARRRKASADADSSLSSLAFKRCPRSATERYPQAASPQTFS